MFGTIVPSYLSAGAASPSTDLLGYSLIPIALGLAIDAAWVLFAAHAATSNRLLASRGLRPVQQAGGLLIIVMAALLFGEALR